MLSKFFNVGLKLLILATVSYAGTIRVVNRVDNSIDDILTLDKLRGTYVSSTDVSRILAKRDPFVNKDRGKMVLYIGDRRIKISGNSSYLLVDDKVFQMPMHTILADNDIFLPAEAFFDIVKRIALPGINYDSRRMVLDIDIKAFTILGVTIGIKWEKVQEKFKKLVKKFHPDMNAGNKKFEEKLKIITLAYTQLKNSYRGKIDNKY